MKISLIVATIRRTIELEELLDSLELQTIKDFEIIIVDQNPDARLNSIVAAHPQLKIQHIKIKPLGVSNARNVGAKIAKGEILGFPDDDCKYFPDTLSKAISPMNEGLDIVSGKCVSESGKSTVANYKSNKTQIDVKNVWNAGVEATIFIRKTLFDFLKGFDESLGVGCTTKFGAGEGTDLLLRGLKQSNKIFFFPDLVVYHPEISLTNEASLKRAYNYGLGIGRVHKINNTPVSSKANSLIRPFAGSVLNLCTFNFKKSKFYFLSFKGRLEGLLS